MAGQDHDHLAHEAVSPIPANAAPGDLELVRAFVNTVDLESGADEAATPERLAAWLRARGLLAPDAPVSDADRARAVELREALRGLILATNEGAPPPPDALATVNKVAGRSALLVRLGPDGTSRLEPRDGGVDAALARLLEIVHRATLEGTWVRLKACRADTCKWAFYDHSKNRSATWCSMEGCGARSKARRYRERKRAKARGA
jgi:predicted RNA-binding Zn ribbon-like protein